MFIWFVRGVESTLFFLNKKIHPLRHVELATITSTPLKRFFASTCKSSEPVFLVSDGVSLQCQEPKVQNPKCVRNFSRVHSTANSLPHGHHHIGVRQPQ